MWQIHSRKTAKISPQWIILTLQSVTSELVSCNNYMAVLVKVITFRNWDPPLIQPHSIWRTTHLFKMGQIGNNAGSAWWFKISIFD